MRAPETETEEVIAGETPAGSDVPLVERTGSFQSGQVFTIAAGHFVHDTYSAFVAPLLPVLQERLGTSYALTGGLAAMLQLPGLLNPFLGYLADRISLRYFVIFAPAVTGTLMSSLGLPGNYLGLALLLIAAGVSVAAFHAPAPAMIGRLAGRRVGAGMSVFMAAGELGRTLGPVIAVAAVGWFGLAGIWRLALIGWLLSAFLFVRLRRTSVRPSAAGASLLPWSRARRVFPLLTCLLLARALLLVALSTYLPLFVKDVLHSSLWLAAASLTILEAAGVAGALLAGTISDRLGRTRVLLILLILSPLLLLAFVLGPGWLSLPLLVVLGFTALAPAPVLLAVVQDEFPNNRALANGTFLALNFLVRSLGIWLLGLLADGFGLHGAFLWSAAAAALAVPAVLALPRGRNTLLEVKP